jgi:hypothetical protein
MAIPIIQFTGRIGILPPSRHSEFPEHGAYCRQAEGYGSHLFPHSFLEALHDLQNHQ